MRSVSTLHKVYQQKHAGWVCEGYGGRLLQENLCRRLRCVPEGQGEV